MKEFFKRLNTIRLIQIGLIIGAIILGVNNIDGWGWFLFLLFITL